MHVRLYMSEVPAIAPVIESAPERDLFERDGGEGRIIAQHRHHILHIIRLVEFITINLPEVIAGCPSGVGFALLVLLARPEAVGMPIVLRRNQDHLVLRILVLLKSPNRI